MFFNRVLEVTIVLRPSNKAVGGDMLKNKVRVPPKKAEYARPNINITHIRKEKFRIFTHSNGLVVSH